MNFTRLPTRFLGVEMFVTLPRMMLMACLLCPTLSWALGLGEIHLHSALNEPLNAEIDLLAATPDELIALRAALADRDAFTRYGIDRPPFLSSLTFKVGKGKDGRDALLVQSADAILPRAVRDLPGRGQLVARPPDARVHGAARSAGVYTGGNTQHVGPGDRSDQPTLDQRTRTAARTRRAGGGCGARSDGAAGPMRCRRPPRRRRPVRPVTASRRAIRLPRSRAACARRLRRISIKP